MPNANFQNSDKKRVRKAVQRREKCEREDKYGKCSGGGDITVETKSVTKKLSARQILGKESNAKSSTTYTLTASCLCGKKSSTLTSVSGANKKDASQTLVQEVHDAH